MTSENIYLKKKQKKKNIMTGGYSAMGGCVTL
jgi:hypothetical protein